MHYIRSLNVFFQTLLLGALVSSCGTSVQSKRKTSEVVAEVPAAQSEASATEPFEQLNIYYVNTVEWAKGAENIGFISLSDDYLTSEHPDSLAIPDMSQKPYDSIQYFKLTGKYRKRFLSGTGISENDKVFVFNYSTGKLLSFPVKTLAVSALINGYTSEEYTPFSQEDYMIGFEIDKTLLKEFGRDYYNYVLVAVGKENPFITKKLKLITWKKVEADQFPVVKFRPDIAVELKGFQKLKTYMYKSDTLQFFMQELKDTQADYDRSGRHVLVLNAESGKVEFEEFYAESEGIGMAPANSLNGEYPDMNQWTGKLFKNLNPVIFGFTFHSFDCERIYFIGQPQRVISTKCDNRH